ncbi:transporter substrate-binding domain-containing protein [Alteromonas sp. 5E99-2]|uniref:substrate-binding periplasmic protein n=1 Tax=Alteromonas sp. 5E99-2 TaxID=2817683 RepID=UPI001A98288D|nr:transporter substrate-binding domain-containing protein [Alteromonas sp. 5E99-2]MBO1256884.1 transporter substrate-binding domain-containing protein [Alteromonas sp. 5E99-2]
MIKVTEQLPLYNILVLLCMLFAACHSVADESEDDTKLVTGDTYFPYISDRLPNGGWSQSIVKAIFNKMGMPIKIDSLPWSRGYQWAYEGVYFGTFPYVYNDQRGQEFLFSNPINTVPMRIFVAANSDIGDIDSLSGKLLCLPYGYNLDATSEQLFKKLKIVVNRAKDAAGCAGQVLKGWSDFGLTNGYFEDTELKARFGSVDSISILEQPFGEVSLHFIISRNIPDANTYMRKFNNALFELEISGEKALIDEHFLTLLSGK